jgi:capsular polysaccharide export protein
MSAPVNTPLSTLSTLSAVTASNGVAPEDGGSAWGSVLRAPLFGRRRPVVSESVVFDGDVHPVEALLQGLGAGELSVTVRRRVNDLMAAIVAGRIGGDFWVPLAVDGRPVELPARQVLLRANNAQEASALVSACAASVRWGDTVLWLSNARRTWSKPEAELAQRVSGAGGYVLTGCGDPWPLIERASRVVVGGADEVGLLALFARKPVTCVTRGYLAGWGLTHDAAGIARREERTLEQLAHAVLLDTLRYVDPFTGQPGTCEATIEMLSDWRRICDANQRIACGVGMSGWKRTRIAAFLHDGRRPPLFVSGARRAIACATSRQAAVAVWASRVPEGLEELAGMAGAPVYLVEDGFLRSNGLGSDLHAPCSIVVDKRGMYYDPMRPSDLEILLSTTRFDEALRIRAAVLTRKIVALGATKYNVAGRTHAQGDVRARLGVPDGVRCVLVPGQVEDDLSVQLGGADIEGNLALLHRVRAAEPNAFIIYKPHPDVEAGHRAGALTDEVVLDHADCVVRDLSMPVLFAAVDAIHVLTSLAGFEALLWQSEVIVHGQPFYAGWGLTRDLAPLTRRVRKLTLDELVAAVLILYPRYVDPATGWPCSPERLLASLSESGRSGEGIATENWFAPVRSMLWRIQGRAKAQWRRRIAGRVAAYLSVWSGFSEHES